MMDFINLKKVDLKLWSYVTRVGIFDKFVIHIIMSRLQRIMLWEVYGRI